MLWLIPLAYCMGSLSSAIIVCRLLGLPDPREQGSGNPGATNVLRFGGKKVAIVVLLGDSLKGLIPVLVGQALQALPWEIAAIGMAAFLGHLYPVFFRFQGGKGVATTLGVLLGFHWLVGLAVIATWVAMALISRISSLSALTASLAAPLYIWLIMGEPSMIAASAAMTTLLFWRHRGNIRRPRIRIAGQHRRGAARHSRW